MYSIKLIGIGAIARVGKDTLADCFVKLFEMDGCVAKKYSLASALKNDLKDFLMEKCNMDVWSQDTVEKSKFRDFLVSYGKIQRNRTAGKYWTSILQKQIEKDALSNKDKKFVAIVPDIRYAEFAADEHMWVKSLGGTLIHLNRIENGNIIEGANAEEKLNAPKIEQYADFSIKWETVSNIEVDNINSYHYNVAKPIYNKIKI
jgi:hypothetical protein